MAPSPLECVSLSQIIHNCGPLFSPDHLFTRSPSCPHWQILSISRLNRFSFWLKSISSGVGCLSQSKSQVCNEICQPRLDSAPRQNRSLHTVFSQNGSWKDRSGIAQPLKGHRKGVAGGRRTHLHTPAGCSLNISLFLGALFGQQLLASFASNSQASLGVLKTRKGRRKPFLSENPPRRASLAPPPF